MRIALLIDSLSGGGSEGVVRRLALGLGERGHDVVVHCLKTAGVDGSWLRGLRIVEHQSGRGDWGLAWRIGARLRRDATQVVHAHSCAALCAAFPAARLLGLPIVHVRHGWPVTGASRYAWLADRLSGRVDHMVINSESGREKLPPRVRSAAIHIPNGLDVPQVEANTARAALAALCGRALDGPIVLTIANVRPEKDLETLLHGFAALRRRRRFATLVVVGAIRDRAYARTVAAVQRGLGLENCVVFAGAAPNAHGLIPAADVLCLSSRTESLPNVILEAMAQRIPIVAAAVGDVGCLDSTFETALLVDGESGLLFRAGDMAALARQLDRTLANREQAAARAARAYERYVSRFTLRRMIDEYESLYRKCLAARPRRAPRRRTVLMVGPAAPQLGGMVSAIDGILASPLSRSHRLLRHATVRPSGGSIARLFAPVRHLVSTARLVLTILGNRVWLVHIHTCSYASFFRSGWDAWLARRLGCRVVLHIRGGRFGQFCRESSRPRRAAIRAITERADAVITLSEAIRADLRPYLGAASLFAIPNGVRVSELPKQNGPDPRDRFRFLFLGELREAKGICDLIEALRCVRARGTDCEAWCVGPATPQARARLQAVIDAAGLAERVRLMPPVAAADRAAVFDSVDCLVHPSHSEGMPNVILEAAAAGLAVVATGVGAVPELLRCGGLAPPGRVTHSGLAPVVHPADPAGLAEALNQMATGPRKTAAIGAVLRAHVAREYGLDQLAIRLRSLYEWIATSAVDDRPNRAGPVLPAFDNTPASESCAHTEVAHSAPLGARP